MQVGSALRTATIGVIAAATLAACGDAAPDAAVAGLRTLAFTDEARGREIPVDLWYPAAAGSAPEELALAGIFPTVAARDAALAPGGRRPLVLLSHGSGGGRADQAWLARALASAGLVVAAVEHPGNRFGDDSPEGVVAVWRRPRDVSVVLDRLLAHPELGAWIDPGRIGAAGHSSGGYTAIALGGALYDVERIAAHCAGPDAGPDCALAGEVDLGALPDRAQAGLSYRDPRVRAVLALAPAVGQGFGAVGLAPVSVPVQVVGSADDELARFALNARHYADGIDGALLTVVQPGGHFVYVSSCNALGRDVAALVCVDPDPATDRDAVHAHLTRLAGAFFTTHLGRARFRFAR